MAVQTDTVTNLLLSAAAGNIRAVEGLVKEGHQLSDQELTDLSALEQHVERIRAVAGGDDPQPIQGVPRWKLAPGE